MDWNRPPDAESIWAECASLLPRQFPSGQQHRLVRTAARSGTAQEKRKKAIFDSAGQRCLDALPGQGGLLRQGRAVHVQQYELAPEMLPNQRFNSSRPISVCLGSASALVDDVAR